MAKKYEMSFELNGEIDPRLKRTFDELSNDVLDLRKDLNTLRKSGSFDEITRDADRASGAFGELREDVREFGDILQRVGQYTGAYAIIDRVTGSIGEMITTIGELDAQSGQLAAATGATAGELEGLQDISQSLYRQGLGEGVSDLTDALVVARNVTKQEGDELERTAKNAIVLQDVFRFDIPESMKASDTMMRQFGITSEESMNLLAQGAQRGLDKSGELLDSANEYAPQFAALGYSAEEMFDIFAAGLDAGAWNLDKVGDLAKEFNIRIQDGSEKTAEALAALFAPEGIEEFTTALTKGGTKSAEYLELLKHVSADTAKEMIKNLQKGGKKAEDTFLAISGMMGGGDKILADLSTGAIKGKDVMQQVIAELNNIEDPVYRNMLGVELFGTQWEDLEKDVVAALGSVRSQFNMTESTMEDMAAVKYDNLTHDLKVLGRELMDEVIIPIGEDLMPVLHDLTDWASDNKDLIKTLALAVPAAMLTKNAVGMAKDFGNIGKAVFDTTNGVSKFSRFVGMMTNPIGIAVGAVGALTAGVIAYKEHQEEARQALINMGDALDGAFDNYNDIEHQTKRTRNLIREYDRLEEKINNTKTPAAELAEARRKQKNVEEELIALNPEILKAEDAKSDSFREQLGLADKLNQTQLEMEKRRLDAEILDTRSQLPQLKEEYQSMTENLSEYEQAYQKARESYVQYQDFVNRQEKIINTTTGEEQARKLAELAAEIESVTGKFYGNNWSNMLFDFQGMKEAFDSNYESLTKTQEELITTEQTFQKFYDTQAALIELNLGAPIEDMAQKYDELTAKEKARFDSAMRQLETLNEEMNNLPLEKQIDVSVVWRQAGVRPGSNMQSMEAYADGGYADKPSIFGEAGPEMAIPINNSKRSRDLYAMTGRMLGVDSGQGDSPSVNFSPVIHVNGGAGNVEGQVKEALSIGLREFENLYKQMQRNRQRVGMS
ncbi:MULTISPECIES: phage tail tape measure protein [Paenibacillus]|uniref:phage tail tape measure protein n=1 Tax=Paenibacillus TaxID=44249 RepID=UPI0011A7C7B2|nr:phage tail tape measure protein [Paenibacillus sp. IHBB 10380]